ncbi:unnamed protein product [Brassica rapa]|uniref:Uncharacterized protein n=1 Tax=Brassica campestris TaxID=3711 RepID=A0A3P5ZHC4_BRACM|nr:unnamed protein product [Brassica rapa]VDC75705.1 unnamed protein product [Brassica rapa]
MMTMAKHMMANTTQFCNKEAMTTSLKNQLKDLQKCLESMVHNQQQANTYFDHPGSTSSGTPMYQRSYSSGFLFGHHTQKTRSPLPVFILRRSLYISLWLKLKHLSSQEDSFKASASKEIRISSQPK